MYEQAQNKKDQERKIQLINADEESLNEKLFQTDWEAITGTESVDSQAQQWSD